MNFDTTINDKGIEGYRDYTTSEMLQASNILDNVYATSVILEGELF